MAKCNACRSGDVHPLCGDNVSCVNCGHTGPPALPNGEQPAKKGKK